mmetsp:Transcript_11987/g.12917  ORF Transcript_11987/g.12917 Transcript_11987/m.12917 type:complete len:275 (-) Transcript_11987:525-1349(-)
MIMQERFSFKLPIMLVGVMLVTFPALFQSYLIKSSMVSSKLKQVTSSAPKGVVGPVYASSSRGVDDKVEVEEYFNNEGFNRWNKIYSESNEVNKVQLDIRTGHQQTIDKVLSWLSSENNRNKIACDAGCGVGSLAIPMAGLFKKVYASDISGAMTKEAADRARQQSVKNIEFEVSDMENLKGSFDTLTCIDVIIHYPTDKMAGIVQKLGQLSKERIIISFAPKNFFYDILKKIGELFPGKSKTTRAYLHTEEDVRKALAQAGFKVRRTETISIS